jgi:hypothetical protein
MLAHEGLPVPLESSPRFEASIRDVACAAPIVLQDRAEARQRIARVHQFPVNPEDFERGPFTLQDADLVPFHLQVRLAQRFHQLIQHVLDHFPLVPQYE